MGLLHFEQKRPKLFKFVQQLNEARGVRELWGFKSSARKMFLGPRINVAKCAMLQYTPNTQTKKAKIVQNMATVRQI